MASTNSKFKPGKSPVHLRREREHHDIDGLSPVDFAHHNYAKMESFLKELSEQYPSLTKLTSIGKSVEGRELYVLEVTSEPGVHKPGELVSLSYY